MTLDDTLQDFLLESQESLRSMEKPLLCIRHGTNPNGMINAIFKTVRSLRTSAVLYKQGEIAIIAREMENLLGQLRHSEMAMRDERVRQLLSYCDIINTLLKHSVAPAPTVH